MIFNSSYVSYIVLIHNWHALSNLLTNLEDFLIRIVNKKKLFGLCVKLLFFCDFT